MRNGLKVGLAVLAAIGILVLGLLIIGVFQWILIGAVFLGICYGAYRIGRLGRNENSSGNRALDQKLKKLEAEARATSTDVSPRKKR